MKTDIIGVVTNPLVKSGLSGDFIKLVLAEAAGYGMPGPAVALLADLAAMLGFTQAMPVSASKHLAGPMVTWRTHPDQPVYERVSDVEELANKQRALIAFGGGEPGQMAGTAEIVIAMGNIIEDTIPPGYLEIFNWASIDVLHRLTGNSRDQVMKDKPDWKVPSDDEVLKPSGRLHATYQEIVTSIRKESIKALPPNSDMRQYLRPVAAHFLEMHRQYRIEALDKSNPELVEIIDERIQAIEAMYPGVTSQEQEMDLMRQKIAERRGR